MFDCLFAGGSFYSRGRKLPENDYCPRMLMRTKVSMHVETVVLLSQLK